MDFLNTQELAEESFNAIPSLIKPAARIEPLLFFSCVPHIASGFRAQEGRKCIDCTRVLIAAYSACFEFETSERNSRKIREKNPTERRLFLLDLAG